MITLIVALSSGLGLSLLLDWVGTVPRSAVSWRRPLSTYLLHLLSWVVLYFLFFCLFQRPWFSAFLVICFQLLLLAVNFAKYHSLREPFLFQDFEYFIDLIRHPRLYLPFFGVWNAIVGSVAFVGLFTLGLYLEPVWLGFYSLSITLSFAVFTVILLAISWGYAGKVLQKPSFSPEGDLRGYGMVAFFWSYYLAFSDQQALQPNPAFQLSAESGADDVESLPDLVVVQSESFFDPRQSYSCVRPDILSEYDRVCQESVQFGALSVPAWGANTVRTECAFLTGLQPKQLGIYQFNPYWYLANQSLPNLVSALKSKGYQTLCIHPYPAGFYMRDRVFPRLGFDRFIDIEAFDETQKEGQYIGDKAVEEKVTALLNEQHDAPLFIFVITMENHGPLHLESAVGINWQTSYQTPPPEGCDDLTVYLRHLKNADGMLKSLADTLKSGSRQSILCWYGDHVPVMSGVYKRLGEPTKTTPYLIWRSDESYPAIQQDMNVSGLAEILSQQVEKRFS